VENGKVVERPLHYLLIFLALDAIVIFFLRKIHDHQSELMNVIKLNVFKVGLAIGLILSLLLNITSHSSPKIMENPVSIDRNMNLSVLEAEKIVTLKRCDNVESRIALHPKVESATTALGKVNMSYFENLIPGQGVIYLQKLSGDSVLAASSNRSGPLSTDFYSIDFNQMPIKVEFIGKMDDIAVLDLYMGINNSSVFFSSLVNDKKGYVWFELSEITLKNGIPKLSEVTKIFRTKKKVGPFLVNNKLEGVPGSTGGRITSFDKNTLIFAIGDFGLFPTKLSDQSSGNFSNSISDANQEYGTINVINLNNNVSQIYSTGHRNPQGLVFDDQTQTLWESEHGPVGGDEINLIKKGISYGWDLNTFGRPYDGFEVLDDKSVSMKYLNSPGLEGLKRWCSSGNKETSQKPYALLGSSSVAPSQLFISESEDSKIGRMGRKLFLGTLKDEALWVADISGSKLENWIRIPFGERIRDITSGQNPKEILLSFDSGRIMSIS
jgi:hypothetical protein